MRFEKNVSLKPYNSFGIHAQAEQLARFSGSEELSLLLQELPVPGAVILGGGSNVLLRNDQRSVLINEVMGIEIVGEDDRYVYVKAGAGETWHRFVEYCIDRDWAGVENLSLIPGKVGAAPMQNIGAYGAELKDVFQSLEAFHLKDRRMVTFSGEQCAFGYRESVFKNKFRGQFSIMNVTFRLNKVPSFNTSYGAIARELEVMGVKELSIRAVSDAVIRIRTSKLPDPKKIGNAGSFFKNPEVPAAAYALLRQQFPEMVAYPVDGGYKLAAGWLIEQCGWKGFREGDAGVHANQALVLVNYGNATGKQLYDLSERILLSVQQRFGVRLEREVNIL
jgi:UDP-N-acetylmuramate dehydrogenase